MIIELQRRSSRETKKYPYKVEPYFMEPYIQRDRWGEHRYLRRCEGWSSDRLTNVFIKDFINLESDFDVTIQAEDGELESWLKRYAAERPKEAIGLLSKVLQIAASKLKEEQ